METDLAGPGVTTARALRAIAGALPSVEVVDSRVADWKIKLVDTVADNASSGLLVVGGRMRKVEDLDLRLLGVVVARHGEVIDTGAGAAALGNPARCVAWLANKLGSLGAGSRPATSCCRAPCTRWSRCSRAMCSAPISRISVASRCGSPEAAETSAVTITAERDRRRS